MAGETLKERCYRRYKQLETLRDPWLTKGKEITRYIAPYRGIYSDDDYERFAARGADIVDSSSIKALRTMAAGLQAGLTSPARPWFRINVEDPDLSEWKAARMWLDYVRERMMAIFARSGTYRTFHSSYAELGAFGTGAVLHDYDYDTVIRSRAFTFGEYVLGLDHRLHVNTFGRKARMTAEQIVGTWGTGKVSQSVRNAYHSKPDQRFDVYHLIEPNDGSIPADNKVQGAKPFRSVYWMNDAPNEGILSSRGYRRFPILAPRWDVLAGHVYGVGPGWDGLPDVKQLTLMASDRLDAMEFTVRPHLMAPPGLDGIDLAPGGFTPVDSNTPQGLKPIFEIRADFNALREDINDMREQIRQAFYADLFLMLTNSDRRQITAREVAERHEEKLLMLGPVLESLNTELLDAYIEMTFLAMVDAGILPPPPPELQGMDIKIEYVSLLAQAQKMVGTQALEQMAQFMGMLAQLKPESLDKFDADQAADEYADSIGVPSSVIVADEMVALAREKRQKAQEMAAMAQAMSGMATTAKDLSGAQTGNGKNALDMLLNGNGGAGM